MFGTNWTATYFNNTDLSGSPVFTEILPNGININWGIGSPNSAVHVDNFSARFTSVQLFEAGLYEFVVSSDAGVRVFISERVVLDQFYVRPLTTDRLRIQIPSAGAYSLKVEYFAAVGQAAIQFLWFNAGHSQRMEQSTVVVNVLPRITSDPVRMAITDAEFLLQARGAVSAVDRVHTALHGYLREVCNQRGITYSRRDGISQLLQLLRQQHPAFQLVGPRNQDVERMLDALGDTLDALNTLRNHASLAHPNPVLAEEDAMLAINATRSIFHYLDAKF